MHFNEVGYETFMARDWSMGTGSTVNHRAQLMNSIASGTRWRFTRWGNCNVVAEAGYLDGGGVWHSYSYEVVHWMHLGSRVASGTVSSPMTSVWSLYTSYVGQVALCGTSAAHSHQSADIGPLTPYWRYIQNPSSDTCWANTTSTTQCPSTYKQDNSGAACPPSNWTGNYTRPSGNTTRYVCETWSALNWYSDAPLVVAKWMI